MGAASARQDIAIVGVGVRLPGADSLDEFWGHLAAGRSLITEVPPRRWDKSALRGDPAKGNKTASIWGGFVADADCFDAAFFNVSPREAAWMDPQQRFALELAWQAIEDAGYRAGSLAGSRTGVFMGVCHWDYAELLEKHLAQIDAYMPTGIAFSIIANRVSHFFDFRGPSITNDTACAASLTSVHEAVQALRAGSCELALAGGVNLIWSPNHFVAFSKNGMLSRDGASKAFDERADGYVRGEGGAMLLLKPLEQALADGDAIHAVIRGSGVNHGGHTNSLTVTSPQAQADLVAGVIEAAGVPPDSIGYIEAHGTGTPLGDPIEITGLKQAFARLYAAAGREPVAESCGIGSVKTNIGHLEGAAGVAGIVKVLAALAHEALPANVDFGAVNSLIRLDGTPFRIQRELSPWPRRPGQPRRAGVSAFGFGGSNAHVLIEEAPAGPTAAPDAGPQWIPLSARDEGRLAEMARRLLAWLEGPGAGVDLADLAWTLQQGREAMAARALWCVADLPALQAALADFIRAGADATALYRPAADAPRDEDDPAARWLAGEGGAWPAPLTSQLPRRRLHLPTYPFARERHWMDAALGAKDPEPVVHPLLHRNLSRLGQQRYRTPLAGSEFFWADHHVGTAQVLPGVVCLEMARAAWAQASGRTGEAALSCDIGQVVWARPVLAGESPARLEIRLEPARRSASADFSGTADELHFDIAQMDGVGGDTPPTSPNAQGSIAAAALDEPEILDLAALRAQATAPSLTPAQLYERLAATGMHHGPAFRAVAGLHAGDGYLLVSLKLPRLLRATLDSFALHPVMLDAAIQAWMGLESAEGGMPGAAVPFSCGRVAVRGACSDAMWALLKPISRQEGGLRRFDIALADRDGRVRLRFHDLALRVMAAEEAPAPLVSVPRWEPAPLAGEAGTPVQTRLLLSGFDAAAAEALSAACGLPVELLPEPADEGDCALAWFEALRERIAAERGRREHVQWLALLPDETHELAGGALAALFRCMAAEQPRLAGAVVRVAAELAPDRLAAILQAEAARRDGYSEIRYDGAGQRSALRPAVVELPAVPHAPFPAPGVVLVTGGAGGLGRHFRAWLAARGVARIVVAGRAAEPAEAISHDGDSPQIFYRSCDVADPAQVRALVEWIGAEVGPLKGIVHGAGLLRDGYLIAKPAGEAAAVFAPKVRGALNLDAATRDLPLDFFLLCSSIAATLGNPGQADYAAANAFMDAFAASRSRQVATGERHGLTVAVAWPLWADGGMSVDAPSLKALQRRFGSVPLPTEVALSALDAILADGQHPCVTLHYGAASRIRQVLADFGAAPEITPMPASAATGTPGGTAPARLVQAAPADGDLQDRTVDWLKDLLGELIQMEPAKIRTQARLEEYGIDSIVIVEMTARMEEALGPLPKTLFFEYVDLAGVAGYLVAEKAASLAALFAAAGAEPAAASAAEDVSAPAPQPASGTAGQADDDVGIHDIAIVGLSLHVAGADDQESFWRMLEQGQHAFRRVPGERWNHEALVHPERDVLGKTVVQTGAFLDGIDRFDPRYFRISQAEAELMSPEVRLFLQTCVEAFEDAGYSRETLQRKYGGNVAVIVGTMTNDYNLYGFQNMLQRGALASGSYTGTVPNMVSYYYGFTGPSYFLDTMCSAAATCVHEAVHMLRSGRAPMVLAGGLSLLLHPQKLIATSQEHFTSKTAEVIRGYGQGADGTILGEGVGALVLKRLADAERDGDHIYGVIKGTGISNAGVRNGFTVPNPRQQAAAIEQALADSGLPPETIGYIEGHGSGTALGDPIEVKALTEAYGRHMTERQRCPIGTVKSNVAHLLGAAALPGIVKVLLQMQRGKLAPSLHAETLNPNIPFADTPFYVQRELAEWTPRCDAAGRVLPRRAGVTSIGAGGINVHLILEEHLPAAPVQAETGPALCVFSAMTPERLRVLLERFDAWLAAHPDVPLADLAWTLQTGRNELPCRFAVVAQDVAQLRQALSRFRTDGEAGEGAVYTPTILDRDPRVDAGKVQAALAGRQLAELARWWADGVVIPWEKQPGAERRRRLSLPSYPFESVRCWYASYPDAPSVVTPMGAGLKLHPFVGRNLSDRHGLRYATDIYLGELLDYVFTWKRQQQLLPVVVAEMAAAVAREAGFGTELALHGLEAARAPDWSRKAVLSAAVLDAGGAPVIELSASEGEGAPASFVRVRLGDLLPAMPRVELATLTGGPQQAAAEIYRQLAESQLGFRPYLEVIETLWPQTGGGALCRLRENPPQQDHFKRDVFLSAPALGAAWQMMALLRPESARHALARIDSLRFDGGEVRYLLLRPAAGDPAAWDLLALTEAGETAAALLGLRLAPPEQLAWSAPEPVRALAAAMPAARLDGGVPVVAAPTMPATAAAAPTPVAPQDGARAAFSLGLRELAGELLKFPPTDINPRSPFYDLGFDSISLTRLANEINARYGSSLTPAIFYECEHIDDLAGWLAIRHPEAVADAASPPIPTNAPPAPASAPAMPAAPVAAGPVAGVAIVGLALRLPGSPDAESFFAHLLAGDDLVGPLPLERYSPAYRARMEAAGFPLQGGFLADIDRFDAAFFKATPHEACRMDPQQRLLLETAQQAVESAGYRPEDLPGATGVFVGVSGRDYASLLQAEGVASDAYVATGNSLAMVANRVSWQFNLHGPSEAVDTACSSSLVALMGAVDAIRQGRCAMALAAGVNLALAIEGFEGPWQAGMLSPTARCRTFAAEADGYVRGEGVVVLVLKDLAAAERDGDAILGLVAGGAVNHGGHAGALTAPSARAQADLVAAAMAGVDPRSIGYIETHGTGTPLGDPVEINGLRLAYERLAGDGAGLRIGLGSVKSNLGHLEAAAGLAGVAKVLLAMAARELPPTLHCAKVNPYVELAGSPFHLVRSRQPWPAAADAQGRPLPRRAGVSSFGFGGSNAHVILEAYDGPAVRRRPALPRRTFADTRYWVPVGNGGSADAEGAQTGAPVLLAPVWLEAPLVAAAAPLPRRLILPCEFDLGAAAPDAIPVPILAGDAGQRYGSLAEALLLALQQALRQGVQSGPLLVQLLVPGDSTRGIHAGLGALLDSASAEVPWLFGQVVEVPAHMPAAEALAVLEREARQGGHRRVRYRDGRRCVRTWQDLPAAAGPAFSWRPGGVYLISGGLGALGRHVARDILAQAQGAHLVLLGQSPLDEARRTLLAELAAAASGGATVRYEQLDIGDPSKQPAVAALVRDCIAQYGALHGVIHCAGIHRDSALIRKTPEQLRAVLAPKLRGALALLEACRGLSLDCFVLFSSLAGAVGNAGQADYAAANGFLAALAEAQGTPLVAIDWPLWREGGMRVDPAGEQAFFDRMGQRPLATRDGLAALGRCLAAGQREVAVVAGEGARIRAFFREAALLPPPGGADQTAAGLPARRAVAERLTGLLADISGLAAGAIEPDAPLENYGIDSLMINRLNQALGERFGRLSKTLFFECRTLAQVADHLLAKQPEACLAWAGPGAMPAAAAPTTAPLAAPIGAAAAATEPIAVIGMSGRYPGAADLDEFWANLAAGRECVDEIPAERWPLEGFYEADPDRAVAAGRSYARRGGFIDGFADFDPLFFRISPREAAAMDPQERLFLMEAWAACEDAGYPRARLARQHGGRVGVFAGVTKTGYAHYAPWQGEGGGRVRPVTSFASIANRVSFCLGLNGPSLPIDTMCSASLTAVHEACEHLRRGECEVALAGGVNLYLHPDNYIELSAARMLSPDGHCRSFGAGGKGFVPGEGVGCLVLKPLSRALADGDRVHGVILGSAINHGGNTAGYTVPNPHAQAAVVREALRRAGVDGGAIGCIEAHGTGTELGDPIEFTGLCQAFGDSLPPGACALGSVKSSIGHLEAAAGIAGLTKVLLQMRHRQLAPTLHAEPANPNLDLAASPFRLQTRLTSWEPPSRQRRLLAGVSSFGAGGANAHVVVAAPEPEVVPATDAAPGIQAVVLSARDPERLREYAERLLAFLTADAAQPAAAAAAAGQPPAVETLRRLLADILSVEPDDIDPAEPFDSYGVEPVHRHALRRGMEQSLAVSLTTAEVESWNTLNEAVAALAEAMPAVPVAGGTAAERVDLADLAWTLQIGREAMEQRLAILVSSREELAASLTAWLAAPAGQEPAQQPQNVLRGSVEGRKGALGLLADEPDMQGLLGRWLAQGDLRRVLGLWVNGLEVDWRLLPRPRPPRIVSAPTYPFARQRFWLPARADDGHRALADALAQAQPGREALLAEQEELEGQLACLIGAVAAEWPPVPDSGYWPAWRTALDGLQKSASHGDFLRSLAGRRSAASAAEAWATWDAYRARVAAAGGPLAQIDLVGTVVRALPDILAGRRPATEVMFPAGRMDRVEPVYKQNAVASRFNAALAAAAAAFVGSRAAAGGAPALRILEIGAGTGGTTGPVLQALAPWSGVIAEYRYTDVSRAFLIHAERTFRAQAPWLQTALLDVEQPLAEQALLPGRYDLVIAANVLHATRRMDATLATVRDLLAPGGLLLVNETSHATLFTHLTFGLLEGWWRFTDPERRIPGTPSLSPASWRQLVEETGLAWLGVSTEAEMALGQQVWAAARSGVAVPLPAPQLPVGAPVPAAAQARPVSEVASAGGVQGLIVEALAATLNLAPTAIDPALSFADYGLDSILGAEFVHRLRQHPGVRLAQTDLFDYPSVIQLTGFLAGQGIAVAPAPSSAPAAPAAAACVRPAGDEAASRIAAAGQRELGGREPIAIVGYSGRFAGSPDPEALWRHLRDGDDLVRPVTRFDLAPFYRDAAPGSWCNRGSFIDAVDRFDARFFNISGLEATYMDPQQRLFLEEAWRTLEHAGHAGTDIEGRRCGVFVGAAHGDYQELFRRQPPGQAFWGNTCSLIPARIAYYLNLKGPAVAVDTACSSSLVAIHLACHSLWAGESELALAGGVFVQSSPRFYRYANQANMLSPSGRCAAFGANADGIVPGEAVAAVLLRPLSQALADGDTIHGLIVASGINQDGATNGITAPSALSQEQLIREAYGRYGIDPARIGLVEAHGTGTPLGDPIEHAALTRAYRGWTDATGYCALGSIKSNLGHATTAAGIAGVLKVLLALKHGQIPPTLHATPSNPALSLADSPFYLNDRPVDWPARPGQPRLAAVSSFGFGGTNAHAVIEEGPAAASSGLARPAWLFVLSARSAAQLQAQARRLAEHLDAEPEQAAGDIAYTLAVGRRHGPQRLVLVASDRSALAEGLAAWLAGRPGPAVAGSVGDAPPPLLPTMPDAAGADTAVWRQALDALAQAYLGGQDVAPALQFGAERGRRVALPTTVFEGKSFWIGETATAAPETPAAEAPVTQVSLAPPPAPRTAASLPLRLAPPAACVLGPAEPRDPAPAPVRLAPLTAPAVSAEPAASSAPRLRRRPDAAGVRHLELLGPVDGRLADELAVELKAVATDESVHAVCLTGAGQGAGSVAAIADFSSLLACPLPVVAALESGAAASLALAAHCDFLVLADMGRYGLTAKLPAQALALLQRRFGTAGLRRLQAGEGTVTGSELAAGSLVVPAGTTEARALELARQIAAAPRLALLELKRHMRGGPQAPDDLPPPALGADLLAAGPAGAAEQAGWGSGRRLELASPVMALKLFADGVALLSMREREHKNTFTPAFMAGMEEAFARLANEPDCKVLVLTGHDAYFACGGTREGLESLQRGDTRFTDQRIYTLPLDFPLPVIAAMQGHAIGAGWSLGLFCDLALFAAESVYHSNYLGFGFTPGAGATLAFPRRLGDDLGREVLFSAREYKGRELAARCAGLPVFPAAEVLPRALAAAHRLAAGSRAALEAAKAAAAAPLRERIEDVLARELAMHEKTFIGNPLVKARIASHFAQEPAPAAVSPAPSFAESRGSLRKSLVDSLAEELMMDAGEIRDADGFLALGLDSILAVTWIRKLNAQLGIELPATCIYAHPSVGALLDEVVRLRPVAPVAAAAPPIAPAPAAVPPAPTFAESRGSLRKSLVESLAEELMMDAGEIRDADGFLALGLDSILAVTWVRKLNAQLGIELPATCIYAHPSVGALLEEVVRLVPAAPVPAAAPVAVVPSVAPPVASPPTPAVQEIARRISAGAGPEDAIAIIGAAGRFPKAADLEAFWANLRAGVDGIVEVPPSRWDIAEYFDPDPQAPGKSYSKWLGAIDDIDLFDAAFFNITAREAELMDPQQRLFLQQAWHALEDAAIDPSSLAGRRCGVFVGSGDSGYGALVSETNETNAYSLIGKAGSILAARIAYLLDLRGPAIALDTACSTSLVAIAAACDSLVLGTSDLALAGGACVLLGPQMYVDTCKVGMLSPDGHCHSFDQRANGFVPGEGVGVVLLKRLADAERDGDPIRAVIRGWGANQDGRTNGITAPNPVAQGELLREVYRRFAIAPASIGLVEAHGTGTPLGDPIEIEGLRAGFGQVPPETTVALGSVKSNIGHLLASAGVAGALKAMLAVERGELPPSIHFERANEHLALAGSPFRIQTRLEPWPAPAGGRRRAAVSAFGFSGTNAHLVLEDYPAPPAGPAPGGELLCVLSARSRTQLAAQAAVLATHVDAQPALDLADLCWTLQAGRQAFEFRAAFVFVTRDELLARLRALAAGETPKGAHLGGDKSAEADAWFAGDADARALLDKWLAAGELERVAKLWVQGAALDWRRLPGAALRRRLHLPGYAFAPDRHWVGGAKLAPASTSALAAPPLFAQGAAGDRRFVVPLRGDEAWLSREADGASFRVPGLFLAELARAAGELAAGHPVDLGRLVWGPPLAAADLPAELVLDLDADREGWRYRIGRTGTAGEVLQVGELLPAADGTLEWPAQPALAADAVDGLAAFRHARPGARGIASLHCGADAWRAGWSCPPGDPQPACALLDAIGQLAAGRDDAAGLPGPRFPLALAALHSRGAVPREGWIWLWSGASGLTVLVTDTTDRPSLWLEGLSSAGLDGFAPLQLEPEEKS